MRAIRQYAIIALLMAITGFVVIVVDEWLDQRARREGAVAPFAGEGGASGRSGAAGEPVRELKRIGRELFKE
ncbi:MAG: hypothetical protein D6682_01940 [Zetaproteobacteria bacterium]|nr:MAG: hypothetical protein D6682_01940 [Zetaproteobacteria bacterium]